MNHKTVFISASILISVIFIAAVAFYKSQASTVLADEFLPALERSGAPIKGNMLAKVTIVEFFDPACETCRQFYPLINNLLKKYKDKVKVEMRYAPFHQGSEDVVKMLEAAHMQGKFWQATALLFATQQRWVSHHIANPQSALAAIKTLAIDHEQLDRDWQSSQVAKIVAQDIKDGQLLKVRATPQFFVNGKPLLIFGYDELTRLVDEAVAQAY